jgi:hypothetical protein
VLLALASIACAIAADRAQPDPAAILNKAGERYFVLTAYSVSATESTQNSGRVKYRLDRSDNKLRLDIRGGSGLFVGDGDRWWHLDRSDERYWTEVESGPISRMAKALSHRLVQRFEGLSLLAERGKFLRWVDVRRGDRTIHCAEIEVNSNDKKYPWVGTLQIDPATGLVYSSRFERRNSGWLPQGYTPMLGVANRMYAGYMWAGAAAQIEYEWISIDSPQDADVFAFSPPPGSKQIAKPLARPLALPLNSVDSSFVPQRNQRIDPSGPQRRVQRREQAYEQE